MHNENSATGAGRLYLQLLRGERPAGAVAVAEVAEALALSAGGQQNPEKARRIELRLFELKGQGLLSFVNMGTTTHIGLPSLIYRIRPMGDSSESRDHRRQADYEARAWGDAPAPRARPSALEYEVSGIETEQLLKVRGLLLADELWSAWADQWCGFAAAVVVADLELTSSELKAELLGPMGSVRKADGAEMQWRSLLENSELVAAAKVKVPVTGDFKKSAKESVWHVEKFKATLARLPYVVRRAPVAGAADFLRLKPIPGESVAHAATAPKAVGPFAAMLGAAGLKS